MFDFKSFRLGFVGFSNEGIPALTKPGALGPFIVTDPIAAVNQRAAQLQRQRGMAGVVAIGHLGASGGNSLRPEPYFASTVIDGPLADLADDVAGVDAVVGDHTDVQVMSPRDNGVLVVENRSKGIRFTRLRLIIDTVADEVVYMTADFHRPWNIG